MSMTIREALLEFCHDNDINVVELVNELEAMQERFANLEKEPEYLQKRVLNLLFSGLFANHFPPAEAKAKRAAIYRSVFGKDEAVRLLFEEQYMPGRPPIRFLEELFGKEMHDDLLVILTRKYSLADIKRMDDYDQIAFIKQVIDHDIGEQFPWWRHHLPVKFAEFMKHGLKRAMLFPPDMSEQERLDHIKEMVSYLELQGLRVDKVRARHLLQEAFDDDEAVDRHLGSLFDDGVRSLADSGEMKVHKEGPVEQVDAKIVEVLSEYFSQRTSELLYQQAMEEAGVAFLDKADFKKRKDFLDHLMANAQIADLSIQRRTIISSWIRAWLNI